MDLDSVKRSMIIGKKVRLRDKSLADARNDYNWQTDPERAQLDATPVLDMTFAQYLPDYAIELSYPVSTKHQFAIDTMEGEHIGNCVYYDIDKTKGKAQLGIMIGNRDYWNQGYGADAITTLVNHIFQQTKLNRIHLKTLKTNARAQKCFGKCGFTPYGRSKRDGYNFVLMELHREQWLKQQAEAREA